MKNGSTDLRWTEPHWSADQRRIKFKLFPFCIAYLKMFSWFAAVGAVFTIVPYWMGDFARQQIWKVWWALALVSLATIVITLLHTVLDYCPPMEVTLCDGQIKFGGHTIGSVHDGDDVSIEADDEGHRWLVVCRRCALSRIGVADEIETTALEECLQMPKK